MQARGSDPILIVVSNRYEEVQDKIPAVKGSSLNFVIKNSLGKSTNFEISFYKLDNRSLTHKTIRRDVVYIQSNAVYDLPVLSFPEEGEYRLVIKTQDNIKRREQVWKVKEF